ncbi:hypothetical protein [Prevotella sp. OH937_COT-195]|uniref:hypothetical protein n=1 Tax=Prevotella sp. OH937_COT-195 TaxID=2491051 RepID=UPI000F64E725|nr:hypothetical protein [Prevotella sp. OH937_COT-195]RRC99811.1 hypothetical protein EII32_07550 [Prevotella sp. OH937_COT-195]
MIWTGQGRPRRFEHRMIYADDRKRMTEKLKKRTEKKDAKSVEDKRKHDFHASFTSGNAHLNRKKTGNGTNFLFIAIVLTAILLAVLYVLS